MESIPAPTPAMSEESKAMVVPQEAWNYEPPKDAVFFMFPNGDKHRRIFSPPQVLDEEEEKKIDEFENYLKDNNLSLPEGFTLRDAFKHLVVTDDNKKAYEGVIFQHETLNKLRPVSQDGLESLLQSGMFYFCNRDKNYRPICILNLKKFVDQTFTDEELTRFTVLMFDYVCNNCMIPGKIENFVVMVD